MTSEVPDRWSVLALWITEGCREWTLAGGGAIEVDAEDREDDGGGTRTRDFERVVIAIAAESENNEDRESVHAKSSTGDARVTCTLSRRLQRRPTAVAHRDGKAKEVVSQANGPQEERTSW